MQSKSLLTRAVLTLPIPYDRIAELLAGCEFLNTNPFGKSDKILDAWDV
jgi:hypothetical protein